MSDEEIRAAAEGGEGGKEPLGAGAEPTAEETAAIQAAEIEKTASAKGWKPEAEYEGPEGGFVGADEFLKREPLFERIRDLSRSNKKLARDVEAMTTQFNTTVKAQVALRIKDLRS